MIGHCWMLVRENCFGWEAPINPPSCDVQKAIFCDSAYGKQMAIEHFRPFALNGDRLYSSVWNISDFKKPTYKSPPVYHNGRYYVRDSGWWFGFSNCDNHNLDTNGQQPNWLGRGLTFHGIYHEGSYYVRASNWNIKYFAPKALGVIGDKSSLSTLYLKCLELCYERSSKNIPLEFYIKLYMGIWKKQQMYLARSTWRKRHGICSDCRTYKTQYMRDMVVQSPQLLSV